MPEHQTGDIEHIEDELELNMLKKRSITGAIAYTARTGILQLISLVAVFLLTIFLSPQEYGVFFLVDATVGFLIYFSDVGLAAALIQKKDKLTRDDLATTFTTQQAIVLILCLLGFLFSGQIANFFNYDQTALTLFRVLVISFFLSSLKTIPSILLERQLEFNKLVIPQILENLIFYFVAVIAAWKGFGVASFSFAVMARAIVGLVAIYLLKPWRPIFGFKLSVAKRLISFGAPFQLNSILSLFKDRLLIIFLGKVLPIQQVGYLGWAEKWAMTPIRFFAEPVLKVTFPAYSRLQHDMAQLKKALEKSIFFVATLVFPASIGIISVAPLILQLIPKYEKWQPALIALTLYSLNACFSSISITLTNTLNATGKVKQTLKLMVMWTILTWILTPILIYRFGYNGVALASAVTASSSIVAYIMVSKIFKFNLASQVISPILASLIMYATLQLIRPILPNTIISVLVLIITGSLTYAFAIFIFAKQKILSELQILKKYTLNHS